MDIQPLRHQATDSVDSSSLPLHIAWQETDRFNGQAEERPPAGARPFHEQPALETAALGSRDFRAPLGSALQPPWQGLSPWSGSAAKRLFDCACVLLAMPVIIPVLLLTGALVRLTSRGPILFRQERMGQHGRTFTILKFRTMVHVVDSKHHPITTSDNQRFTPIGPFLRRWKLDELPQVVNVLLGHMSLVGPRPKLPEHVIFDLPCRPGITGLATIAFADEETVLAEIPKDSLDAYYHAIVLPAKRILDADYMAGATFLSDLQILVNSVLRRWHSANLENLIVAAVGGQKRRASFGVSDMAYTFDHNALSVRANQLAETE